ncbi:NERD domain-containing protein [Virgibacillus pantothenticus]|uniref:NERD domain-containing protein n=1 Tax=Virgibacillus TaxID=84406 RepID=UPI000A4D328F|nr:MULTISPECIES: NERD domain-containing protein [Virgibacillus]MBS7429336.1 NERD domain-containing protein [Virgibacillus sp. 19R1-5]MBU8568933.1 NERD domain-containing protein [Virgibacillus pantothenticus]MBU8602968.1 NERD domain-containing protein [Virgibacillus pantothenticus]MBU8637054.1 NERD domain-containing protein [Virgibacillus pantothenticus]MBU8644848.1 NERD domain-containing protein [Virgibacillus pantothenticus]
MKTLAQLIKLQDYISRYEWSPYRYPSQFIRLKNENWHQLKDMWEKAANSSVDHTEMMQEAKEHPRWKLWKRKTKAVDVDHEEYTADLDLPETEQGLKQYYLDKLLHLQMKWATSTVTDISFVDKKWTEDNEIKYFLQRFPDTYLFLYYPIFTIKKAPVECEIILISPIGIEIICQLRETTGATIIAQDARTWIVEKENSRGKLLNPHIALKRTENIIKGILSHYHLNFPITKTILAKSNPVQFLAEPYQTKIIGKQQYDSWFSQKRNMTSPLKNQQLKVAEALLKHVQTTSVKRPEWEEERNPFEFVEEES